VRLPVPPGVVRVVGSPLVSTLARTWRYRTVAPERWLHFVERGQPFIFLLWHEAIFPLLWHHRKQGIAIIVSQGREGQYIGDYASRLGYRILHGSSSRGGTRALLGAVRALEEGSPDGPKGPRRCIKPGVVQAAQRVGAAIIPLHAEAASQWRARSWDRLVVPRPGAKIVVGYGEPFTVGQGAEALAAGVTRCGEAMIDLEAEMAEG
jgi:lysophospholipid acyltransferase (LPLAT)-like uncharacterized protein